MPPAPPAAARSTRHAVVVGAGPAGLMAAEVLAAAGHRVTVVDHMPSPARKFLMAGRGGLNLTHSEALPRFLTRYGAAAEHMAPIITDFPPDAVRVWADGLGADTFVGSSGRVFPRAMKASPLLRAWLQRLSAHDVRLLARHLWTGWDAGGSPTFRTATGASVTLEADALILALGGASWPRLGSNGAWTDIFRAHGIPLAELEPANAGLTLAWSQHFAERFAGSPLKRIAAGLGEDALIRGEAVVTRTGIEGGVIYALSGSARDLLTRGKPVTLTLDLRPDLTADALAERLSAPRGKQSQSNFLRRAAGLAPVQIALLREGGQTAPPQDAPGVARLIKGVRLPVTGLSGLERAISTAGGVPFAALSDGLMLKALPGVFVCGEMLDWEAPTGGYLLQGCLSTAVVAARAAGAYLAGLPVAPTRAPAGA